MVVRVRVLFVQKRGGKGVAGLPSGLAKVCKWNVCGGLGGRRE